MILEFYDRSTNIDSSFYKLKENPSIIKKVIIYSHFEFHLAMIQPYFAQIYQICEEHNIPIEILTGGHESNNILSEYKNLTIHYWPTYWFSESYRRMTVNHEIYNFNKSNGIDFDNTDIFFDREYNFLYISLNKVQKIHRSIMMDMLAKYNLLDYGAITWRSEPKCKDEIVGLSHYNYKYWTPKSYYLDQTSDQKLFNQETLPAQYSESFMQLVPESEDQLMLVSEKTAMPLFFCKPFLVASCKNFHMILQEMGFKLYNEIFDYTFDTDNDIEKRYDLIAQEIKKLSNLSNIELNNIKNTIKDKLLYNRHLALEFTKHKHPLYEIRQDKRF